VSVGDAAAIYQELDGFFDHFSDEFASAVGLKPIADHSAFWNIGQSQVYDLNRYAHFHELQIPDRARRAAYLVKWIQRLRPVRVEADITALPEERGKFALLVNEQFALYVASGILRIDLEQAFSAKMLNMILYTMRYRSPSEDSFLLFFVYLSE